jgi:hypothetical protein
VGRRSAIGPAVGALLILLCAIWGVGQVAIKVGNQGISPLWHAAIRSAGSALLLWVWSAGRGISLVRPDGTAGYGVSIAVLFALEFVCVWGSTSSTGSRMRPEAERVRARARDAALGRGDRTGEGRPRSAAAAGSTPCRPGPEAHGAR